MNPANRFVFEITILLALFCIHNLYFNRNAINAQNFEQVLVHIFYHHHHELAPFSSKSFECTFCAKIEITGWSSFSKGVNFESNITKIEL